MNETMREGDKEQGSGGAAGDGGAAQPGEAASVQQDREASGEDRGAGATTPPASTEASPLPTADEANESARLEDETDDEYAARTGKAIGDVATDAS